MAEDKTTLPRFSVSEWHGLWWLDRHGAGRDVAQCVGPFRERAKAAAHAAQMNEINRRLETGELVRWADE